MTARPPAGARTLIAAPRPASRLGAPGPSAGAAGPTLSPLKPPCLLAPARARRPSGARLDRRRVPNGHVRRVGRPRSRRAVMVGQSIARGARLAVSSFGGAARTPRPRLGAAVTMQAGPRRELSMTATVAFLG